MIAQVYALLERLFPRLASAGVAFLLALLTDPRSVGMYSIIALGVTGVAAMTDAPARQLFPGLTRSAADAAFARWYRAVAVMGGGLVLGAVAAAASWAGTGSIDAIVSLAPVAVVPAAWALGISRVALLQRAGRWRTLARNQFIATAVALGVCVAMLVATHNVIACVLYLVVVEWLVAGLNWWSTRGEAPVEEDHIPEGRSRGARFRSVALYSLFGWLQGQGDRLGISVVSGAGALGIYSMGASLGRALGDSIAVSNTNVCRSEMYRQDPSAVAAIRTALSAPTRRAIALCAAAYLAVSVIGTWLCARILDEIWRDSIVLVPVIGAAAFPMMVSTLATAAHARLATGNRALVGPVVGILLIPVIALASLHSFMLVALLVVLRESVVSLVSWIVIRAYAPRRTLGLALAAGAASAAFGSVVLAPMIESWF